MFVGNLPWTMDWRALKDIFTDYEPTFATIKMSDSGRSRGYGIVRFDSSKTTVDELVNKFNGMTVNERDIVVREDRQ